MVIYSGLPNSHYSLNKSKGMHSDDLGKFRILIIDDDPDLTLAFKASLQQEFAVEVFNNPIEALSQFKAGYYDLLLIDIKMPNMNGFELYREIVKIDTKAKICFITSFVSYYESLSEIYPEFKVGCFIKKPIEADKLIRRIRSELG
jgi:DNA-binding response OmpR family regulator